jgi:hypothetical protein
MRKKWLVLLALLTMAFTVPFAQAGTEEDDEDFTQVIKESGISKALQGPVSEMFKAIHNLEVAFRDEQWAKATIAVEAIDNYYNELLEFTEQNKTEVPFGFLQAFEFSLTDISSSLKMKDRAKVEESFLTLQPELFDILDMLSTVPLRLTASRLYIDMAITAFEERRFDVVLDELGEIEEYLEQLEPWFKSKGSDLSIFRKQLSAARKQAGAKSPETLTSLEFARKDLIELIKTYLAN